METSEQKIARLFEAIRYLQAENWAIKHFITAMYAQNGDINNTINHFSQMADEIHTHNTFSTLPEDFVTSFREASQSLGAEAHQALQRATELRAKK
jgi:hypothetical protein